MADMDVTATNMLWRPKLIRLTQIGNPYFDAEKPTTCFVDPGTISAIYRQCAVFKTGVGDEETPHKVDCTLVHFCHGTLYVTEFPEEVSLRREQAYGHERPKPRAIT